MKCHLLTLSIKSKKQAPRKVMGRVHVKSQIKGYNHFDARCIIKAMGVVCNTAVSLSAISRFEILLQETWQKNKGKKIF